MVLPRVFLANLLSRRKKPAEALEVWRELFARFPEPELEWFVSLANALKALGRREERLAALEDGARRFPQDRRTPPLLAEVAEERGQWARALEIWGDYRARDAARDEPKAAIGRARALFRLGRVDEASQTLEGFLAASAGQRPGVARVRLDLGRARRGRRGRAICSRGLFSAALNCRGRNGGPRSRALITTSGTMRPAPRRSRSWSGAFPTRALAEGERLRLAKELEHGHDDLKAMISAARARFPADFNLRSHWVWILLSLGRLEEAEREVKALEAEEAPGFALTARLRLEADRGDEALHAYAERFLQAREWDVADAMQVAYALARRTHALGI